MDTQKLDINTHLENLFTPIPIYMSYHVVSMVIQNGG